MPLKSNAQLLAEYRALVNELPTQQDLAEKVTRYILWHNERGKPFRWSYRPSSWTTNPAGLVAA
jgi:hypothetical protein